MSVIFPPVIPGPEMAAPTLWAPGIFWFFLLENPMPVKFLLLGRGWGWFFFLEGGGWKCQFYFYGRGDFPNFHLAGKRSAAVQNGISDRENDCQMNLPFHSTYTDTDKHISESSFERGEG